MAKKEQHFFGSDLAGTWKQPTPDKYFASFSGSESAKRRGEASGWYLWSRRAAEEIRAYRSDARIVAMLRNPIEMLPSLHSQYLFDELEDLGDFGEALAAEADRRRGKRIPPNNRGEPWRLFYRDIVCFSEQLERYATAFGWAQLHVIVFDDLRKNPYATYRGVLDFLDVDTAFVPDLGVINPNKRTRSRRLKATMLRTIDPSSPIRRVGTRAIPVHALRSAILKHGVTTLERMNTSFTPRPPLPPQVRANLASELVPEIHRLGELLGRDLTFWLTPHFPAMGRAADRLTGGSRRST